MEIMQKLKAQTRSHHDVVEEFAYSNKIMDGTITLEEYKELVLKNYHFHLCIEEAAAALLSVEQQKLLAFGKRGKLPLLREDLLALGLTPDDLTMTGEAPEYKLDTLEAVMGALYVAEGSTLGGAVIQRKLAANPAVGGEVPMHFYGCYGKEIGEMWKSFMMAMVRLVGKPEQAEAVVGAAQATFDFFLHILKNGKVKETVAVTE